MNRGFLPNWERYLVMSLILIYFMLIGLTQQSLGQIVEGLINILREPDLLITDYFVIGGVGAAFFNGGILNLICDLFLYIIKADF